MANWVRHLRLCMPLKDEVLKDEVKTRFEGHCILAEKSSSHNFRPMSDCRRLKPKCLNDWASLDNSVTRDNQRLSKKVAHNAAKVIHSVRVHILTTSLGEQKAA
eukprot:1353505-Amphidinium_carterae.1